MDVKYQEPKELVIHHLYQVSTDELTRLCLSVQSSSRMLFWHNGILFFFYSMPHIMSGTVSDDYLKGREHWEEVFYAEQPKFQESMELEDGEFKGAKLRVVKASNFTPHKEFAEWVVKLKK